MKLLVDEIPKTCKDCPFNRVENKYNRYSDSFELRYICNLTNKELCNIYEVRCCHDNIFKKL